MGLRDDPHVIRIAPRDFSHKAESDCSAPSLPNARDYRLELSIDPKTNPIVFIPGILGSILVDNKKHPPEPLWPPRPELSADLSRGLKVKGGTVRLLELTEDEYDRDSDRTIRATAILWTYPQNGPYIAIDAYHELRRYLERCGYEEGKTFFPFPYDWRKDLSGAGQKLALEMKAWKKQFPPNARFTIVAHSMGGLVGKYLISTEPDSAKLVKLVVTIGTPLKGAPLAFKALVTGEDLSEGYFMGDHLADWRKVAQTFPSVYELLPVYPFVTNRHGVLRDLKNSSEDIWPKEWNPDIKKVVAKNVKKAHDFRAKLRESVEGVTEINIVGKSIATLGSVVALDETNSQFQYSKDTDGDGTVPAQSAWDTGSDKPYFLDDPVVHRDLPKARGTQNIIGHSLWFSQ